MRAPGGFRETAERGSWRLKERCMRDSGGFRKYPLGCRRGAEYYKRTPVRCKRTSKGDAIKRTPRERKSMVIG